MRQLPMETPSCAKAVDRVSVMRRAKKLSFFIRLLNLSGKNTKIRLDNGLLGQLLCLFEKQKSQTADFQLSVID